MSDILLTTLNARYSHASLGLRYLLANMGELRGQTRMMEFTIKQRPIDIAEKLLAEKPKIIGIGVYIWNARECEELVALLKQIRPEVQIIVGGPEVSYESEQQLICKQADHTIRGQADLAFASLCRQLLDGHEAKQKIITAAPPGLDQLSLPYREYSDEDIAHRVVYVEASRGCPFKCEFCLSALDKTATPFELDLFLGEMETLSQRGLRHFKFVDRTFNLKVDNSLRILEFFLQRLDERLFLHFELIPDHLPERLKEAIKRFPAGSLQFEIGVQSLNPEVQHHISRKQDNEKTASNLHWIRNESHAHIHADLIIGLPGEDIVSFAQGFDQLLAMGPHEVQVGILKRLRGTPVIRHTDAFRLRFSPQPPYNILSTDCIDFDTMQRLSRFARYWDLIANSGRFRTTLPLLLAASPFDNFLRLSDRLYQKTGQTDRIQLQRLFKLLHEAMTSQQAMNTDTLNAALLNDFRRCGQKGTPGFLKPATDPSHKDNSNRQKRRRQERHTHEHGDE
jgi:radical SAM superfamily enzyme YgiQ (UPF0313 family)